MRTISRAMDRVLARLLADDRAAAQTEPVCGECVTVNENCVTCCTPKAVGCFCTIHCGPQG